MRTFEEINADIGQASRINDAVAMSALAAEIESLGTPRAVVAAQIAFGTAARMTGNYPAALEHYDRALALAEEMGDRTGAAAAINNMGNTHLATGNYPAALEYFGRALAMHQELGNRASMAGCIDNIGMVHLDTGDYPSALEHFSRALAMHEEMGNHDGMAHVTGNIGIVHSYTGDNPLALEHFNRALAMHEGRGNLIGVALATGNAGIIHMDTGDYPAALEHYHRALALHEELGDRPGVARTIGNMATALTKAGRYNEAEELLERQADMQLDEPSARSQHFHNRSKLAECRDDLAQAQHHLLESLAITTTSGLRAQSAMLHMELRDLAQKRNDFAGYIEHNNEYNRIIEEIRGKETTQRLAMMEAERKMEAERREREKERALLHGALPKSVADRMLRGEDVTGDQFDHAAVMFADIVGFTSHSSGMSATGVVKLLEGLFRTIDGFCDAHNVVKIKTVGDSYMSFRGDADAQTNALCIMQVALEVMNGSFTWPNGEPLQFRIGLHIGEATAGVIGTQRLQYDVWGDTVNVASRMESSGEPGRIHVSAAFANSLNTSPPTPLSSLRGGTNIDGDHGSAVIPNEVRNEEPGTWHLAPRGSIDIKGKGAMETYWLTPPSSSNVRG